jgi:hypothetical protein
VRIHGGDWRVTQYQSPNDLTVGTVTQLVIPRLVRGTCRGTVRRWIAGSVAVHDGINGADTVPRARLGHDDVATIARALAVVSTKRHVTDAHVPTGRSQAHCAPSPT